MKRPERDGKKVAASCVKKPLHTYDVEKVRKDLKIIPANLC